MSQLLPVLNARIGSDPVRGDLRGATRDEVERAYTRQIEADEQELKQHDLSAIEPSTEFGHAPFDLAFEDLAFSIEVPVAPKDGEKPKAGLLGQKTPTETKVILEPTSGSYRSAELVALMGPSGCGKSTLLDMIADVKTAPYTGTVYFNGRPRDKTFRLISSYVPQEDISFEHCTVREIVQFHMKLKADVPTCVEIKFQVPTDAPTELMATECERIMSDLGLKHVADTKFGGETVRGLSGGQRRRVTLAKGVCAWPHLIFADEPTSGLSATDAELVVRALRQLVHKYNVLCMVVIHQPRPEVAALFDRLLLLTARPGRCVYDGPMSDLADYCGKVGYEVPLHQNAADFALDVITPDARGADPEKFADYYKTNRRADVVKEVADARALPPRLAPVELVRAERERFPQYSFHELKDDQHVLSGFGPQFLAILRRRTTLIGRNPELGLGIFIGQVLQGLIASLVVQGALQKRVKSDKDFSVYQNQLTVMMNITMNVIYISLANIPTFFAEKVVCVSEQAEGLYSGLAYLLASTVSSIPVAALSILAGTLIQYLITGPDPVYYRWYLFPEVYLNAFLLYLATDSLFQFFAVTQKSSAEAQNVAFFTASRASFVAPTPSPRRLFFFGFISMFNGVAPTPSAFPVWIRWGIWVSPDAAWKSTSELDYCGETFVNLNAVEPTRSRGQRRVDGVGRPKIDSTQAHLLRDGQSSDSRLHRRGQRQHGEHHERRRRVSARVSFQRSARCHSRRDAVDGVRAGFRNDISYGSIAPPVTYVLFVVFIVLMKAATVYAMRGLKQAK